MRARVGVLGLLAIFASVTACNTALDCPPGQTESNGACVGSAELPMCSCGENTHYDNVMLACVPDYPSVVCGFGTVGELRNDGITVCKRAAAGTPTVVRVPGADQAVRPGAPALADTYQASACCAGDSHSEHGVCVANHVQTICDPATTIAADTDSGVQVCQPIDPGSCPNICNNPDAGNVTICGQLYDIETNTPIGADTGAYCDPLAPADSGPCALEVLGYDALSFAADPSTAPLPAGDIKVNECGEFVIHNIPTPSLGFVAVAVDDASKGSADDYALTGVAMEAVAGQRITGVHLFATQRVTDQRWTASAGDPFSGATFSERGVVFIKYTDTNGDPISGVTATVNGSPEPARTYYFSDSDPNQYSMVDAAATTSGTNGAALVIDSDLVNHSGSLGGCNFTPALADSIPGVVFATERICE